MTKSRRHAGEDGTACCAWCGRRFVPPARGRPPKFCRQGCRQQAFVARKLAAAHGLGDDDVIVSRARLEEIQSNLYCLQSAVEDVDRDLVASEEPAEVRAALEWLLENCRPFQTLWVEQKTPEGAR